MKNTYLFDGKIEVIKFVRDFSGFGLVDSKRIVEIWMEAVDPTNLDFHITNFNDIRLLSRMVGKVVRGTWHIFNDGLYIHQEVKASDIASLY